MSGSGTTGGAFGIEWVGSGMLLNTPQCPGWPPTEKDAAPGSAVLRGRPCVHYLGKTLSPVPAHTGHLGLKQVAPHCSLLGNSDAPGPSLPCQSVLSFPEQVCPPRAWSQEASEALSSVAEGPTTESPGLLQMRTWAPCSKITPIVGGEGSVLTKGGPSGCGALGTYAGSPPGTGQPCQLCCWGQSGEGSGRTWAVSPGPLSLPPPSCYRAVSPRPGCVHP